MKNKMKAPETLSLENVTLEKIKYSTFGCANCLWHCIECKDYEKFSPKIYDNMPTCTGYVYYD